jgi:hypothetical protein
VIHYHHHPHHYRHDDGWAELAFLPHLLSSRKGHYANTLVLLFQQMEQCIRRIYSIVNNCPETILSAGTHLHLRALSFGATGETTHRVRLMFVARCAESDVLYTTLDILLASSVGEKENRNLIYDELGDHNTNVLLDTFIWAGTVALLQPTLLLLLRYSSSLRMMCGSSCVFLLA